IHAVTDLDVFEQSLRGIPDPSLQLAEVQRKYASITTLMSEMCAPARDEAIRSMAASIARDFSVDTFEGITCELWRMLKMLRQDMASFGLASVQPVLLRTAIEYEQSSFRGRHECIEGTRSWISASMRRDASMNSIWSDAMTVLLWSDAYDDAW